MAFGEKRQTEDQLVTGRTPKVLIKDTPVKMAYVVDQQLVGKSRQPVAQAWKQTVGCAIAVAWNEGVSRLISSCLARTRKQLICKLLQSTKTRWGESGQPSGQQQPGSKGK